MREIWTDNYRVTSYLVDCRKELSLFGLLSLIQEAAWEHAEQLGYGYSAMLQKNLMWALIRQKMNMEWWPHWGQEVAVRTWLCPVEGLLVRRDLEFYCGSSCFCRATALYLMLDHSHRHPAPAPMQAVDFYCAERGPHDPQKLPSQVGLPTLARFPIRTSDLDMHAHVNNTRIGQWLSDAVSAQAYEQQRIVSYEVDFQAEMQANQTIAIEAGPLGEGKWHFQGRREGDSKIVFSARVGSLRRT